MRNAEQQRIFPGERKGGATRSRASASREAAGARGRWREVLWRQFQRERAMIRAHVTRPARFRNRDHPRLAESPRQSHLRGLASWRRAISRRVLCRSSLPACPSGEYAIVGSSLPVTTAADRIQFRVLPDGTGPDSPHSDPARALPSQRHRNSMCPSAGSSLRRSFSKAPPFPPAARRRASAPSKDRSHPSCSRRRLAAHASGMVARVARSAETFVTRKTRSRGRQSLRHDPLRAAVVVALGGIDAGHPEINSRL